MTGSAAAASYWRSIPKAELHLHFEGAIEASFFDRRSDTATIESYDSMVDSLRQRMRALDSLAAIEEAAASVAAALCEDGVVLAEVHLSPGSLSKHGGLAVPDLLAAASRGFGASDDEISIGIIVDLVRHHGRKRSQAVLAAAIEVADELPIVACGLGGYERLGDTVDYGRLFVQARQSGLRTVAHGGEHVGPGGIEAVLDNLQVDRIGHGTSAVRSAALRSRLATSGVPVEVCLTSNVATGVVRNLTQHPFGLFVDDGIHVVLSTDDPGLLGTCLTNEFVLAESLGVCRSELLEIARRSIEVSFFPEEKKQSLLYSQEGPEA